jgi:hypothetical protein
MKITLVDYYSIYNSVLDKEEEEDKKEKDPFLFLANTFKFQ